MARTRAHDYAEKESQILLSAARLFSSQGADRTSMVMVANACGVSKSLLYHYYDSKESLLFEIVSRHMEYLNTCVAAVKKPDATTEQNLGAMVEALLRAYGENEDQHRIQLAGLSGLSEKNQRHIDELQRNLVQQFADVIVELMPLTTRHRLLKPVTMSLFGMLNWHYMWFREQGPISRQDYAALATGLIVDGASNL